jgi:cell division protein FtsI/penicillin-binding protein 2
MAGAFVLLGALVGIGFTTDFGTESSAEPIVQSFLLDWEQGHYTDAAKLTNGPTMTVSGQLAQAFHNLNATALFLSLTSVRQHGSTAVATFNATVDLAAGDHEWHYEGQFALVQAGGHWRVDWAPSVIEPHLGTGDRLAVVTKFSPRGQVTDATGQPLVPLSGTYYVGVYPGKLADPRTTAASFAQVTGLNKAQVLGQISSAPPQQFLPLLVLDPADFASQWPALSHVHGLTATVAQTRLFNYDMYDQVGQVGTETSPVLRAEGAAYEPGATAGQSGLEQAYQDMLAGTPDMAVVVINAQGRTVATLWTSPGVPGRSVRTTIEAPVQSAADAALNAIPSSGEIVAVDAATGYVVAVAGHQAGDLTLPANAGPLTGRVAPGIPFTIVSAAALLSDGLQPTSPLPCQTVANVGGQTFTYSPGQPSSSTFGSDFASGCGTAFATVSLRLSSANLAAAAKDFGIGASWNLPVAAFSGSVSATSSEAALAAAAIGTGGVKMSPLGMALVAAEVDAGSGHSPTLTLSAAPAQEWPLSLSPSELTALRGLMRGAVTSGPARAANLPGAPVSGQAGVVQAGPSAWLSWFVGYRGDMAFAVLETGHTQAQAAASLAASFLSHVNK